MGLILRRELLIFVILMLILAPLIHPDFLNAPVERFKLMMEKENFFHPFIYILILYLLIAALRFFYLSLTKLLSKRS
ncbi:MAG: hypothetical protein WA010_07000 [Sulfuricurvum sp.]